MRATAQTLCSCCYPTGLAHPGLCRKASMQSMLHSMHSMLCDHECRLVSCQHLTQHLSARLHMTLALPRLADLSSIIAGEELFTCYKASTSACTESDLEDRLIRWGFPLPQPQASQGEASASCTVQ